ncbi:MAG: transcription termination/antitermination NusG family protein, partial [Ruminococcus sp.]
MTNANSHAGGEPADSPLRDGLASNAIPEVQSSQTGVSVENIQLATDSITASQIPPPPNNDGKPQWFVLRVSYGRAIKASKLLGTKGITTFNPLHDVMKRVQGRLTRVQLPLLPGLIFAHTEAATLASAMQEPAVRALVS